jgi:hypothetical protein
MGDSRWELKTSLERHTPAEMKPSDAEIRRLHEFKRRAHTYLQPQHIPAEDNAGEWLALMQHFGAPTRLLDVTESPYVAVYFAIEEAGQGVEACAVWAINRIWCLEAAGNAILKDQPDKQEKWAEAIASGLFPEGYTPDCCTVLRAQGRQVARKAHASDRALRARSGSASDSRFNKANFLYREM